MQYGTDFFTHLKAFTPTQKNTSANQHIWLICFLFYF